MQWRLQRVAAVSGAVEDTLAEFDAITVDTIPVELLGTIHTSKPLGCQTKGQSRF